MVTTVFEFLPGETYTWYENISPVPLEAQKSFRARQNLFVGEIALLNPFGCNLELYGMLVKYFHTWNITRLQMGALWTVHDGNMYLSN